MASGHRGFKSHSLRHNLCAIMQGHNAAPMSNEQQPTSRNLANANTPASKATPGASAPAPDASAFADIHVWAMRQALTQAEQAQEHGDVPVGAVVLLDDEVLAAAKNERELRGDPTAHAEVLAIRSACDKLGGSRLDGAVLVTTLEPCPMCAGAAGLSRVAKVVFGAADPKAGACGSLYNFGADPRLSHNFEVVGGVLEPECAALLLRFFADRR